MKILIIGGTGVLSSAVTAEAINQGFKVTMINRGRRTVPYGVELIKAEMNDKKTIAQKLVDKYFDAVLDFLCFTDEQTENSVRFYSNYTKQYFFISSCAVYDTKYLNGQQANEDSKKVLSVWKYSVDKWASEQKIKGLLEGTDVKYTIIRPCVTYDNTRIPYGIMPPYGYHWTLCARILADKPVITWNNGQNRCNMTRVEDFAFGVVGLIGNSKAFNEAFNVCGDDTPSFGQVLEILGELLGKKVLTIDIPPEFYAMYNPSKAGEIVGGRAIDTINSNKKLKEVVPSFKQTILLKDGIKRTIEAYKSNGYQKGVDWEFDANTDRIIRKWCKKNKIDHSQYKIKFIDYLNKGDRLDRIRYKMIACQDNILWKSFFVFWRIYCSSSIRIKRLFSHGV